MEDPSWDFLAPWCSYLKPRVEYCRPRRDVNVWGDHKSYLKIIPPSYDTKHPTDPHNLREALCFLAFVASVDQKALKKIFSKYFEVVFGQEESEQEILIRVMMNMDLQRLWVDKGDLKQDLILLCGAHQRENPTQDFLETMEKIALLGDKLLDGEPGEEIEISVRVFVCDAMVTSKRDIKSNEAVDYCEAREIFLNERDEEEQQLRRVFLYVQSAFKLIQEQWEKFDHDSTQQEAVSGDLRCTFVLEPMVVEFNGDGMSSKILELMEPAIFDCVPFSRLHLSMGMYRGLLNFERASRRSFGHFVARVFGSTQCSNSFDTVHLQCRCCCLGAPRAVEFEMICSALVVNQTIKNVSMDLGMQWWAEMESKVWWKWVAYALFSKRARACSIADSVELVGIQGMTAEDMESFSAILLSDHPEEELLGYPRGQTDEKTVTLKKGTYIRWPLDDNMKPISPGLTLESPVQFALIFSDDGLSEWVNVLASGFGSCQVRRSDIKYNEPSTTDAIPHDLLSLKISYCEFLSPPLDGLPQLLAAIGSSLKSLTLEGKKVELDGNMILQNCPNLIHLSFNGKKCIDVRLNFSEYREQHQSLPSLNCNWNDIAALLKVLNNADSPISKCVRRLRVRLDYLQEVVREPSLDALLQVLAANQTLEYLDVAVPPEYISRQDAFRTYHLAPINRARQLSMGTKLAFLSVFSASAEVSKRRKVGTIDDQPARYELDQSILSMVLAYAAPPVLRKVYFHNAARTDDESPI